MRKPLGHLELSRTELEIVKELTGSSHSLSELAERIGKSSPLVKEALTDLHEKGLVESERRGKNRIVMLGQTKHAQLARELFLVYPHIPWEDLLSFSGIAPLLQPEVAGGSAASKTTERRAFSKLAAHGIITKEGKRAKMNPRFGRVQEFVSEMQNYWSLRLAAGISPFAVIVWRHGSRFIIRVPRGTRPADARFSPTGTTALPSYGIQLMSDAEYFFFSPSKNRLRPEDIAIHLLLLDGVTNVTYTLLLLVKTRMNARHLVRRAEIYGLRKQIEEMIRFLDVSKPEPGFNLPSWEELSQKASDYGVKLEKKGIGTESW